MGTLINFLANNYIYFVFIAILLVLGLIGYIVDSKREDKIRKELTPETDLETLKIPEMENVKLAETINNNAALAQKTEAPAPLPAAPSEVATK